MQRRWTLTWDVFKYSIGNQELLPNDSVEP